MKRVLPTAMVAVLCMLFGCDSPCPEKINQYEITLGAHSAVTPVSRIAQSSTGEDWWMPRHRAILDRNKQGEVDMIFVGDSITHSWENVGKDTWERYYAKRNAVNMGVSGDCTQHALWRLQNGEITGITPKLAVILIGINNADNTSREIADGIIAICQTLRANLPKTKILILAIFPAGTAPDWGREKNAATSKLASAIADNRWIYYLDIGEHFLDERGYVREDVTIDTVHPSPTGYRI